MNVDAHGKTAYTDAINLLANADEYDINLLLLPGVISSLAGHSTVAASAIQMCEDRGDAFTIVDPVAYASSITDATTEASSRDTNYAAMYWPWIQIPDNYASKNVFVPITVFDRDPLSIVLLDPISALSLIITIPTCGYL